MRRQQTFILFAFLVRFQLEFFLLLKIFSCLLFLFLKESDGAEVADEKDRVGADSQALPELVAKPAAPSNFEDATCVPQVDVPRGPEDTLKDDEPQVETQEK